MVLVDFLEASRRRCPQARPALLQVEVALLLLVEEEEAEQAPEQEHDQEEQGVFLKGTSFWNPSRRNYHLNYRGQSARKLGLKKWRGIWGEMLQWSGNKTRNILKISVKIRAF